MTEINLTVDDVTVLEAWWIQKSRKNFLAYRMYMRYGDFEYNWFIADLCEKLQQFYLDLKAGKRPILVINTPPQHGKSWAIADFVSWMSGKIPELRTIYATFSDQLGKRCNLAQQRFMDSDKYRQIFPGTRIAESKGSVVRNTEQLEFIDENGKITGGQFRNTTTGGRVNGESLDLGIIDDAVKGRKEAESITVSEGIWNWFTDDFNTRFSKLSGLIAIMTRWTTHDIIARIAKLKEKYKGRKFSWVNYQAIATKDEKHRKTGEALFPALKPLEFLEDQKATMSQGNFEAIYQGKPTIQGGNLVKDDWWKWWKTGHLPPIEYKIIVADTAQKTRETSDWSVFQCWGVGFAPNKKLFLLDKKRDKFTAPQLRREAYMFYKKHDTPRLNVGDPVLRKMYIEDKSSGTGLIQELQEKGLNVEEVPRDKDKIRRCKDAGPEIEAGRVYLNVDVDDVGNTTKEAREFPNSEFDDDFDTAMQAIEVTFLNATDESYLEEAMAA
jgi:predicted phage terminase large subunit-like protein